MDSQRYGMERREDSPLLRENSTCRAIAAEAYSGNSPNFIPQTYASLSDSYHLPPLTIDSAVTNDPASAPRTADSSRFANGLATSLDATASTSASDFANKLAAGSDPQALLDSLANSYAGGDALQAAKDANKSLVAQGMIDSYYVTGTSDGTLNLTHTGIPAANPDVNGPGSIEYGSNVPAAAPPTDSTSGLWDGAGLGTDSACFGGGSGSECVSIIGGFGIDLGGGGGGSGAVRMEDQFM
jgi:hypothetical protein